MKPLFFPLQVCWLGVAVTCSVASSLSGAEPFILVIDDPWDAKWDPLMAAAVTPDMMLGQSHLVMPAKNGLQYQINLSTGFSGQADDGDRQLPGLARDASQVSMDLQVQAALGGWSLHLAPTLTWADDPAANRNPRLTETTLIPHLSVARSLGDVVLYASNEPVTWGEALHGDLLLGGNERGAPRLGFLQSSPWAGLELQGEPIFVSGEGMLGYLDAEPLRAGLDDGPAFAAGRLALRYRGLRMALARRWIVDQRSSGAGTDPRRVQTTVEMALSHDWARISTAVGFDPEQAAPGQGPTWIVTLDGFDLDLYGRYRLAAEWHHSSAANGQDSAYLSDPFQTPTVVDKGGSADVVSLRWSHRLHETPFRYDVIPSWQTLDVDNQPRVRQTRLDLRFGYDLTTHWTYGVTGWLAVRPDHVEPAHGVTGGAGLLVEWNP